MPAADVLAEVERRVPPTPFENEAYPRNPTVRRYPKSCASQRLGQSKRVGSSRRAVGGRSQTRGRRAYEAFTDPAEFMAEAARLYRARKRQQPPNGGDADDEAEGDSGNESVFAIEEAEEAASSVIRDYLAAMPPYEFQNLVAALLKSMGYSVLWVAPPGPDQGIDVIASTDPLERRLLASRCR
jgi:restriction system protein